MREQGGGEARRTSQERRDDVRRCRDGVNRGQRQGAVHGICARMREGRTLGGYILVCLATAVQVQPVSADGARTDSIEEGGRVVRGGSQAGSTEGHIGRGWACGACEERHKHGGVCRGDDEIALIHETRMRAECVRENDGE